MRVLKKSCLISSRRDGVGHGERVAIAAQVSPGRVVRPSDVHVEQRPLALDLVLEEYGSFPFGTQVNSNRVFAIHERRVLGARRAQHRRVRGEP